MGYVGVKFVFNSGEAQNEILMALLGELEYESFEELDNGLLAYIQETFFNEESLNDLTEQLVAMDFSYSFEKIEDKNWNEVWESNYPAVTIGGDCHVRAPFHEPNTEVKYEIVIEPQMSFGTAHHETTAMILEYILKHEFVDEAVLDMGCGTGVLSILAAMKGAKTIEAIDIDEWAYKNSLENVKRNGFPDIKVIQGSAFDLDGKSFSVVFANINRNILLKDMKAYVDCMTLNSRIYFSGFYESDLAVIREEAENLGLSFISHKVKNNWTAAYFEKK